MAKLTLDGCDVAGLLDDVLTHRVARRVGRLSLDPGHPADLVPDHIDGAHAEPLASAVVITGRQEERRRASVLGVRGPLVLDVIPDRGGFFDFNDLTGLYLDLYLFRMTVPIPTSPLPSRRSVVGSGVD